MTKVREGVRRRENDQSERRGLKGEKMTKVREGVRRGENDRSKRGS